MNLRDFVHIVCDWLPILSGECSYDKCCILSISVDFNFDLAQYCNFDLAQYWENSDELAC